MFLYEEDAYAPPAPPTDSRKTLRDYQAEAIDAIERDFAAGTQKGLLVLATGLGKTVVFARLAADWRDGNVLILAHRVELLDQAADKLQSEIGYRPPIEQGERGLDCDDVQVGGNIVVGSVQTCKNMKRMEKYRQHPFSLVILDECHHATAASYRRIMDACLEFNPDCKFLGVTATPNRTDKAALGMVFDKTAYVLNILHGIDRGYLVPVRQESIYLPEDAVDFSNVTMTRNKFGEADFDRTTLESVLTEEGPLHAMAKPILDRAMGQSLVFTAGVTHAHLLAKVLNRYRPGCAAAIDGKTEDRQREHFVKEFKDGKIQYLTNYGIFCLDEETEILTQDGWVGIDEISYEHRVANWENGAIFFDEPRFIVKRDRLPGEKMVVLETPRRSIRVTEDHRMLYRTFREGEFKIKHAGELVGKAIELPVSGMAAPVAVKIEQPLPSENHAARVRANSYVLRQGGMSEIEAKQEAIRRIAVRDSLRYTEPHELTDEDCEFIGFWIGDGSRCELQSGGVEYTVAQSPMVPKIVERIEWLLEKIGTDFIKRRFYEDGSGDHFRWSIPRGTGFGPQKRSGIFRLEPYLQKSGTDLFWALNGSQFEALMRGLWMADGEHGDSINPPETMTAAGINIDLFDLLQAIGSCRGYRISIHFRKTTSNHHTPLMKLSARRAVAHATTKHCLRYEDGWKQERVWCVTSTTGNIVTRRKGTVTVTGNTEGFDVPETSTVVMGRPTKSISLFTQMLGRGTRPLAGVVDGLPDAAARKKAISESAKPYCVVMDFVGNTRHRPASCVDALGGDYDVEVRELAADMAAKGDKGEVRELLEKARKAAILGQLREFDAALAKAEDARKRIVARNVRYEVRQLQSWDDQGDVGNNVDIPRGGATEKQVALLVGLGVAYATAAGYGKKQAGAVIDKLRGERCTVKQANILRQFGHEPAGINMQQASVIIDQIKARGWK